uniref:kelch-like protein 25 n=1 Tax=Styela clava TaxID=7725 RepID=UPI00193A3567|nr:kelch-like protein 25 [Styela clava]
MDEKTLRDAKMSHFSNIFDQFCQMREEKKFCDFVIKVGSEEFHAHRYVLSSASRFFKAIFSDDPKVKETGILELNDVHPDVIKECLDFTYMKETPFSSDKFEELLYVGTRLQLDYFCAAVAGTLGKNLTLDSFLFTMRMSKLYNNGKIEDDCNQFAAENLRELTELDDFNLLDECSVTQILKIKNSYFTEELRLHALLKWTKFDVDYRGKYFEDNCQDIIAIEEIHCGYKKYLLQNESLINGRSYR